MDKNLVLRLFTSYGKLLYHCFKYLLKKKQSFLATPNVENKWWTSYEKLKVLVKWNRWWNFVFAQFLWTLKFIFSRSQGKLFSVLFQSTIYILSFKKMLKDCKILKIILLPDICPLKSEIAQFSTSLDFNPLNTNYAYICVINGRALCTTCDVINLNVIRYSW